MNCKYIQFYNFLWIIDQNDESDDESLGGWVNWFCERYDDALEMILSGDKPESEDLVNQK